MEEAAAEAMALAPEDTDIAASVWGHCRATVSLLEEERERARRELETGWEILSVDAGGSLPFPALWALMRAVDDRDGEMVCGSTSGRSWGIRDRRWTPLLRRRRCIGPSRRPRGGDGCLYGWRSVARTGAPLVPALLPATRCHHSFGRRLGCARALAPRSGVVLRRSGGCTYCPGLPLNASRRWRAGRASRPRRHSRSAGPSGPGSHQPRDGRSRPRRSVPVQPGDRDAPLPLTQDGGEPRQPLADQDRSEGPRRTCSLLAQ